jgi:hypothetical protein
MNDKNTLLTRRAHKVGTLTRLSIPPRPQFPESFLNRFPELRPWAEADRVWVDQLELAMNRVLATPEE